MGKRGFIAVPFLLLLIVAVLGCGHSMGDVRDAILETERMNVPVRVEEFSGVHGIEIRDVTIDGKRAPYSGYLSTTWDIDEWQGLEYVDGRLKDVYVRKKKDVQVMISDISVTRDGIVIWLSDWSRAYRHVRRRNNEE